MDSLVLLMGGGLVACQAATGWVYWGRFSNAAFTRAEHPVAFWVALAGQATLAVFVAWAMGR
jgi:hypothetical protein